MTETALEQKALPIPDELDGASDHVLELARIWWSENGPRMNIRPALREPADIGIVLAELAWHYSHAYAEHRGFDQQAAFEAIQQSWTTAHERAAANAKQEGGAQ